MNKCLQFVVIEHNFILRNLFAWIPVEEYFWQINQFDAYSHPTESDLRYSSEGTDIRFKLGCTEGADFRKKVDDDPAYSLYYADFRAFPSKRFEVIKTYDDYLNSDCQIVFILESFKFPRIYAKNPDILTQIGKNAEACGCTELEYLNDEECRQLSARHRQLL